MNVIVRIREPNFDSKIEIPNASRAANCEIYLELRVLLVQFNGASFTRRRRTYRTQAWTPGEWNQYRYLYQHTCEHWWSHQFWLRTPTSFNEMNLPLARPTHRPNFRCKLRIILVRDESARRHARIRVVRLADDERNMRSASRTYDNRDLRVWSPRGYPHITAVHEVGHLLGLRHPGVRDRTPACLRGSEGGNSRACYEPANEAMGSGMDMVTSYATPWRRRLARHTRASAADWTVSRQDIAPVSLSRERLMGDITGGSQDRMRRRVLRSTEQL